MNKATLKISKKEFHFSFGLGFLGELLDNLDLSIDQVGDKITKNPFKLCAFIYVREC